jgi:hypothetical protein
MIISAIYLSTISNINNVIGFLYLGFIITGFRIHPNKRYYRQILEKPITRFINGLISMILFVYGIYRMFVFNGFDVFLLTPFLFYSLLLLVNYFYRVHYNRTVNLILRYDFEIDDRLNIWDKIMSILILIIPIVISFLAGFLIVK